MKVVLRSGARSLVTAGAQRCVARPSPRTDPTHWSLASAHLPGWDYLDTYTAAVSTGRPRCAMTAAQCLLAPSPGAVRVLALRDLVTRFASLKPAVTGASDLLFPVVHASRDLVVLGFDDRHLDFRVLVDIAQGRVRCTTVVRRHHPLGRAYFGVVGPVHRLIMPRLLAKAARDGWRPPDARRPCVPAPG